MYIRLPLLLAAGFVMAGSLLNGCMAQSEPPEPKIKVRTLMESYEPDLVLSAQERLRLKIERRETVRNRTAVIDTLDIPERKRKRLLRELHRTPFSDEYNQVLGEHTGGPPPEARPD